MIFTGGLAIASSRERVYFIDVLGLGDGGDGLKGHRVYH
jgi:hypothetical protein